MCQRSGQSDLHMPIASAVHTSSGTRGRRRRRGWWWSRHRVIDAVCPVFFGVVAALLGSSFSQYLD